MSTNCLCKLVVLFLVHCRCRIQSLVCSLMSICILWFAHGKWSHLQYIWREDLLSLCMQTSYLCTLMMCSCCYRSQQSDFFFLSKQFPIIISALTHKSTNFLSRCLFYIFILTGILLLFVQARPIYENNLKLKDRLLTCYWIYPNLAFAGFEVIWMQLWKLAKRRMLLSKRSHSMILSSRSYFPLLTIFFNKHKVVLGCLMSISLTYNISNVQAAALALKKVPEVNSSWTDDYIRQ